MGRSLTLRTYLLMLAVAAVTAAAAFYGYSAEVARQNQERTAAR
jgi:hypothetical protein